MKQSVIDAVDKLQKQVVKQGGTIDLDNANYDKLTTDVQAEYACGCDGSIFDVIVDINDSVGLDEYGIILC